MALYFYSVLGELVGVGNKDLQRGFAVVVSNFILPKPIEGKCSNNCSRMSLNKGEYYKIALGDPILLRGKWKYAGSARKDSRSRRVTKGIAFGCERWCLFEKGKQWVAVHYSHVTRVSA